MEGNNKTIKKKCTYCENQQRFTTYTCPNEEEYECGIVCEAYNNILDMFTRTVYDNTPERNVIKVIKNEPLFTATLRYMNKKLGW